MEKRIVKAVLGPMPKNLGDAMPTVTAEFDDGSIKVLFEYYPDEVYFSSEEFVGLTEKEAHALRRKKDRDYISSF